MFSIRSFWTMLRESWRKIVSSTGKLFKGKGIKKKCFEHARTHEHLKKKKIYSTNIRPEALKRTYIQRNNNEHNFYLTEGLEYN